MRRKLLHVGHNYRLSNNDEGRIISIVKMKLPSENGSMLPAIKMKVLSSNTYETRYVFLKDIVSEAGEPMSPKRMRAKTIQFTVDYIGQHVDCGSDVNLVSSATGGGRLCAGCGATGVDAETVAPNCNGTLEPLRTT